MVAEADWVNNNDLARLGAPPPPPVFFVSVASKAITKEHSASVADTGFTCGRFRLKPSETRCWLVSVASKEIISINKRAFGGNLEAAG
jgi:hypothetical protein